MTSGVPQGTVLAPLLFLNFINDLPNGILSKIKLYADDVLLFIQSRTANSYREIWILSESGQADEWKMVFNPEFLRITNKKHLILNQYKIQNKEIKEVAHAKYLGVTISHNLTWSEHIKQTTNKANRTKRFLQRNLHNCPLEIKTNCYKVMVKPILDYAAIIWSPHTHKRISI